MMKILTYVSRKEAREQREKYLKELAWIRIRFPRFKRYKERDILRLDEMAVIS